MKPRIHVVQDWPQPDTVGLATVVMIGSKLVVGFGTGEEQYALVSFPSASDLKSGGANDEVLHGHPLYGFGLKHYSIHRIENSPWLRELEFRTLSTTSMIGAVSCKTRCTISSR